MKVSTKVSKVGQYIFAELAQKTAKVEKESGMTVLNLAAGNVSVAPSKNAMKELSKLTLDAKNYIYPGYGAIPVLEQALRSHYDEVYDVELNASQIQPVLGAKDGIASLTLALTDPGDEILIPNPGYPAYTATAKMFGIKPVYYTVSFTQKDGQKNRLDISKIESKITKQTKFIWVNFPSNPTGEMITKESLTELVAMCKKHKIWLLHDHAYSQIFFGGQRPVSVLEVPGAMDVAIELGSFSKSHSFAGLRMGWVVGNEKVVAAMKTVNSQIDSGLSLPLQKLAAYVLTNADEKWHKKMIKTYTEKRDKVAQLLTKYDLEFELPQSGLYIWARVPKKYKDGADYAEQLLSKEKILVVPGTVYGSAGKMFVRASFAPDISLIERYL